MALRTERQSARMSKINSDGLTQSGSNVMISVANRLSRCQLRVCSNKILIVELSRLCLRGRGRPNLSLFIGVTKHRI